MSRYEIDKNHVFHFSLPRVKKLPPNPHIGPGSPDAALQRAEALPSESNVDSEEPPEPPVLKCLRHKLLACDQRSFLTGSASSDLEVAHILNPVRKDLVRKERVERLLTVLRLHDYIIQEDFRLDSPGNAILLEASLHKQWDSYGTFVFVPTEADCKDMLDELKLVNKQWAMWFGLRPIKITEEPFANPRWEILILHPQAFLPNDQPIPIAQNRTLIDRGQSTPAEPILWSLYVADGDNLRSMSSPTSYLAPFYFENLRQQMFISHCSTLAMIINSHFKLSQFIQERGALASDRIKTYSKWMKELAEAILFLPLRHPIRQHLELPQDDHHLVPGTNHVASVQLYPSCTPSIRPTADSDSVKKSLEVEDVKLPEVPDPDDNLTDSEFNRVMEMATDALLDSKKRLEASMMLLFGARGLKNPYVDKPLQSQDKV